MKIVINKCFGGFSLSDEACAKLHCKCYDYSYADDKELRTNENLIHVVEELGERANGRHARLVVVTLPNETTDWEIDEYDGGERITFVVDGLLFHK